MAKPLPDREIETGRHGWRNEIPFDGGRVSLVEEYTFTEERTS